MRPDESPTADRSRRQTRPRRCCAHPTRAARGFRRRRRRSSDPPRPGASEPAPSEDRAARRQEAPGVPARGTTRTQRPAEQDHRTHQDRGHRPRHGASLVRQVLQHGESCTATPIATMTPGPIHCRNRLRTRAQSPNTTSSDGSQRHHSTNWRRPKLAASMKAPATTISYPSNARPEPPARYRTARAAPLWAARRRAAGALTQPPRPQTGADPPPA